MRGKRSGQPGFCVRQSHSLGPSTSPLRVFLVLRSHVGLEQPWQYDFFILSSVLLRFNSLSPHLSLEKKKKAKFGT